MPINRSKLSLALAAATCALALTPMSSAQARRGDGFAQRGVASGGDCSSPIALPAFPAGAPHTEAGNTAGAVDDYSDTCLNDYDGGEDLIYEFEVTETTCLQFTLDADTIWAGFAIASDCSDFSSCLLVVDEATDPDIAQVVLDPGTYYIIVDTFAPPNTTSFDLTIEECPTGACCLPDETCVDVQEWECIDLFGLYQGDNTLCSETTCPSTEPGDNCFLPLATPGLPDNLPYVDANTTAGRGNNYVNTCLGPTDAGEDMIYEINVTADVCLRFTLEGSTALIGMALHDTCPIDASTCIATAQTFATTETFEVELTAGVYYLQVDTWAPPASATFDLTIEECPPFGACCLNDGSCVEASDFDCAAMDGEFQGDGTDCGSITCPDPLFGACCLPDDTCTEMFENECDDLAGSFEGEGTACVDITCPVPPVNDNCDSPLAIGNGATAFTNADATTDGPAHAGCLEFGDDQISQDVWFIYTATCTGDLLVSTCDDADFDTKIAVYATDVCEPSELEANLLGCVDDTGDPACGTRAELVVPVDFGMTYLIRVGAFGVQTGEGVLVLDCDGVIPCPGDANADLMVDLDDLLAVIGNWGGPGPNGDVNASGMVDLDDLLAVIGNWGADCTGD